MKTGSDRNVPLLHKWQSINAVCVFFQKLPYE